MFKKQIDYVCKRSVVTELNAISSLLVYLLCTVFSSLKLSILLDNETPKYKRMCSETTAFTSQNFAEMTGPIEQKRILLIFVFLALTCGEYTDVSVRYG